MEAFVIFVMIALSSVIWGLVPAYIAKNKGRSFLGLWVYGALFFIAALPHALLMKANPKAAQKKFPDAGKGISKESGSLETPRPVVVKSDPVQPAAEYNKPVRQDVGFYQYEMMTINTLKTCAVCSDKECPCSETPIPEGSGFLYISQDAVVRMKSIMDGSAAGTFGIGLMPILMCEQGAKRRGIELMTASHDAKLWWKSGRVRLRPTPMA